MLAQDSDVMEIWETTTEGTVWVWTKDVRQPGHMQKTRVGGRAGGSKRLRISRDERRYNEDTVIEEMIEHNPFRSGLLRLVSSGADDRAEDVDTTYHLENSDLLGLLEVKDDDLFKSEIEAIRSELIIRRLYMMAEKAATVSQLQVIRDVVEARYKVGGTQRTVREMEAEQLQQGGSVMS